MGSKGSNTTTQNQTQTYNPTGAGYIQSALNQGQAAAQLPFNVPAAPVAGFSQDQQTAFNTVNGAQGQAQPYLNTAASYYSPQGAQAFFNPYADAVTAQMNNVFGQQQSQATGQLTQAAGGVGADRIAVGQGELANQQSLAAGQTYANLYGTAVNQAQAAGAGTANIGLQAQNAALTGAQAQLGTGGLQQQLSQAQMNSPYQLALAQAAFPYQQAQFNAGITGALAPGLGGTTNGTSQTTAPAPSLLSQILGLGTAGVGLAGGMGAFNGGSGYQNSTGNYMGMTDSQQDALQDSGFPLPSARGGAINPYARGGRAGPYFADGGAPAQTNVYSLPSGFNDKPINIDQSSIIPTTQLQPAQTQQPHLTFSAPAAQQQSNPMGDVANIAKMAMMFANRGGRIDPKKFDGYNPYAFADGGDTGTVDLSEPFRMPDAASVDAWRKGVDTDMNQGMGATDSAVGLPKVITGSGENPFTSALSFSGSDNASNPSDAGADNPYVPLPRPRPEAADAAAPDTTGSTPQVVSLPSQGSGSGRDDFMSSPWAAVMAAGLGIAGGTSPFAAVNIGSGGMQGVKMLQTQKENAQKDTTIAQAAKRLEQEAKFHEDAYTRRTLSQQDAKERQENQDDLAERQFNRPYQELTKAEQARVDETRRQNDLARIPEGMRNVTDENGNIVRQEAIPGGLHDPDTIRREVEAKQNGQISDAAIEVMARQGAAGDQSWSKNIGRGAQSGRVIERVRNRMADILTNEQGKSPTQAAEYISNAQKEWSASQVAANAGARTRGTRIANLDMILDVANAAVPAALEASAKVNRTRWVPLNSIIQKGQVMASDPDLQDFGIANLQLAEGWARAMNPTGVMRESDRDKALEYLGTKTSADTYERAVRQIQKQIQREKDAISTGHSPKDNERMAGDIPPPQAIELLASDPKKYRDDFEKRYGKGSADRFGGG